MKILPFVLLSALLLASICPSLAQSPDDLEGNWMGRWENLTFGSKDSATMTVTLDTALRTANVILDLDGSVFGGTDPAPLVMTGSYTGAGFTVSGDAAPYGPITLMGDNAGMLSGLAPNVPSAAIDSVTMSGSYDEDSLTLDYTVYFPVGGATGIITMEKQTTVGVEETGGGLPDNFVLYQNYPNPFNPSTVITYDMPREASVSISIYDISGGLVAIFREGLTGPGTHTIEWSPDGLAAGLYYYRLDASFVSSSGEAISRTRKMVYLK